MRKHLLGLAIFISIVTAAVLVYGYFDTQPIPVIPAVEEHVRQMPRHPMEVKVAPRLSSQLVSILYDETTGKMTAIVDLEWNGTLPKPSDLRIDFSLVDPSSTNDRRYFHSVKFKHPFSDSLRIQHHIEWDNTTFLLLNSEPNWYAYAEAVDEIEEFRRNESGLLVLVEKNYLAMSVPILVKHAKRPLKRK